MSQKSFQQIRQNFTKQRRKEHLEQIFRAKRKQNSQKVAKDQKETFLNLFPTIDMQNYEQNRYILSDYARSTNYSYQMLPIAFISFDYLLNHPHDNASWQVLTYLSDYEDFQIPQIQEFVEILIKYLNQDPQLISQFLFNISKLPKCSLLCCRLIDASIFYIIQQKVLQVEKTYLNQILSSKSQDFKGKDSMELQIHNFLFALCNLFSIQPMIELHQMNKICSIINIDNKSNKFLKQIHAEATFNLIQNAVSNLSHQPPVIKLLLDNFQLIVANLFTSFSEESIMFLDCCIKNKVRLSQRLISNLFQSIKFENRSKIKASALRIVRKILDATSEKQKMQVEANNIQTLQPFIEQKVSISFQDFNSMFTSTNSKPKNTLYQEEIQNFMLVCSLLFTQNYDEKLKKWFEMFQISGDNVKQQIVRLILSMINSLIRQIDNYEPKKLTTTAKEVFVPEKMEEFLFLTIEQDEFFYWIEQCLKIENVPIVQNALNILMELTLYFRDCTEDIEEDNSRVSFSFIVNQIHKFGIHSSFEDLAVSQNPKISDLAEDLLSIMEEVEK